MKSGGSLVIAFLLILTSCKKGDIAGDIPSCIRQQIVTGKMNPNWTVGSVEEFMFQNKIVYAFNPNTEKIADGASGIVDSDCNTLCSMGGFGGTQINLCNGDNFFQAAVFKRVIWKKK
jgi:hypothetical protein